MQGKIIKGIAGFYYVHTQKGIFECKAKGAFRNEQIKPLVGDDVILDVVDVEKRLGNVVEILPRRNALIRPAVANVDQALIIFSIVKPNPNYNLLDRFLIMMEKQKLPCIICFNKQDIASAQEKEDLRREYETCGYQVLFVSAMQKEGMEELSRVLAGKTTTVAGPSGVGKSTIVNSLYPEAHMETGEISHKIERGKHTTRHSELFAIAEQTYIVDTPGFTSLSLGRMEKEELGNFYPEFTEYEKNCRFAGCSHISEPECGVKQALLEGKVGQVRYHNYVTLYEELKKQRKY